MLRFAFGEDCDYIWEMRRGCESRSCLRDTFLSPCKSSTQRWGIKDGCRGHEMRGKMRVGGVCWNVRESASFKDIIGETVREDVEREGERKSIFYLQWWCGGNEEEWNSCRYGPLSFSASAMEWSKNPMPWHTLHETRWGHICFRSGGAQLFMLTAESGNRLCPHGDPSNPLFRGPKYRLGCYGNVDYRDKVFILSLKSSDRSNLFSIRFHDQRDTFLGWIKVMILKAN